MLFEQIIELVKVVSDSALTEFKYEEGAVKLSLKKNFEGKINILPASMTDPAVAEPAVIAETAAVAESAEPSGAVAGNIVKSPLVGTFYVGSAEDADPFVKVGDSVSEGQTLAIVEAMKLMNEIESEYAGTVVEVLVKNGAAVEFGQPLFVIA